MDLFCHISQHDDKNNFKKILTCLTSCQTTSGAPIGDLIVAFCTHFIFRKSHERAAPNAEENFLLTQKLSRGCFTPSAIRRLKVILSFKSRYRRPILDQFAENNIAAKNENEKRPHYSTSPNPNPSCNPRPTPACPRPPRLPAGQSISTLIAHQFTIHRSPPRSGRQHVARRVH